MIQVTRRYRISASHRLHSPLLSEEENRRIFGRCNNPHGHGHDYTLEVTAQGDVDDRTGSLIPLGALDRLVEEQVLSRYHLRNLNEEAPEFATVVPTTENLAAAIALRLGDRWRTVFPDRWPELARVRILETKRNIVETHVTPPPDAGSTE